MEENQTKKFEIKIVGFDADLPQGEVRVTKRNNQDLEKSEEALIHKAIEQHLSKEVANINQIDSEATYRKIGYYNYREQKVQEITPRVWFERGSQRKNLATLSGDQRKFHITIRTEDIEKLLKLKSIIEEVMERE
tara:strand:+ start:4160 stop:4564 length:405 start_codon:yes stop_codon:yes gene_type:complete